MGFFFRCALFGAVIGSAWFVAAFWFGWLFGAYWYPFALHGALGGFLAFLKVGRGWKFRHLFLVLLATTFLEIGVFRYVAPMPTGVEWMVTWLTAFLIPFAEIVWLRIEPAGGAIVRYVPRRFGLYAILFGTPVLYLFVFPALEDLGEARQAQLMAQARARLDTSARDRDCDYLASARRDLDWQERRRPEFSVLQRIQSDGTLDASFAPLAFHSEKISVSLRPDGRALVHGALPFFLSDEKRSPISEGRIFQIDGNGKLDTAFSERVLKTTPYEMSLLQSLDLDSLGGAVATGFFHGSDCGESRNAGEYRNAARWNETGEFDAEFDVSARAFLAKLTQDGDPRQLRIERLEAFDAARFLWGGIGLLQENGFRRWEVVRSHGTEIDTTFSFFAAEKTSGSPPERFRLLRSPEGRVVALGCFAGSGQSDSLLAWKADGTRDVALEAGARAALGSRLCPARLEADFLPDGSLVLAASLRDLRHLSSAVTARMPLFLVKLNTAGVLDREFSDALSQTLGACEGEVTSLAATEKGEIWIAGHPTGCARFRMETLTRVSAAGELLWTGGVPAPISGTRDVSVLWARPQLDGTVLLGTSLR